MQFYLIDRRSPDSDANRAAAKEALEAAGKLDLDSKRGRQRGFAMLRDAKEQHRKGCRLCSLESLMWADVMTRLRDLLGVTSDMLAAETLKHGYAIH